MFDIRHPYYYSLREAEEAESDEPDEGFEAANPDSGGDEEAESSGDTEESPDASEEGDTEETDDTAEESDGEDTGDEGEDGLDIDATDDTGDDESDSDGEGEESSDEDDSSGEDEEEIDPNSLKALDGKIYQDLSPAEQKLKEKELRRLFTDLYTSCSAVADRINTVVLDDDNANLQIKRTGSFAFILTRMVSDYFLNTFSSKSYEENDFMFNKFLYLLNQVKDITDGFKKMYSDDSE